MKPDPKDRGPAQRLGLVQVYTGNGKGKTTAALGLSLRACGHGLRTYIGQFAKGRVCGELAGLGRLAPNVRIEQYGADPAFHEDVLTHDQRQAARAGLGTARAAMQSGEYQIVILDEVLVACRLGLIPEASVLTLIDERPPDVELVLTGRDAPPSILERADLVTEMREVKHPFSRGIEARIGIEY
ncbi:cob(I)yrinic acid a,c-diamide adenosyltransferase [Candidatus Bipolaricaulota bacterium]